MATANVVRNSRFAVTLELELGEDDISARREVVLTSLVMRTWIRHSSVGHTMEFARAPIRP